MRLNKFHYGLYYRRNYISKVNREKIIEWLGTLYPIWEERYSKHNPPPPGQTQRKLLRPVYWLGNWQFACLDYYHPPKGIKNRCVEAEKYPAFLQKIVDEVEKITKSLMRPEDIPKNWHLNTCLINYYGDQLSPRRIDCARVGEHKDFEPGPVASISFGERAMFQFVSSKNKSSSKVVLQQWLDDCSLQIFAGKKFKDLLFHRVQRVEKSGGYSFKFNASNFETRRINFTFRYVPVEDIAPFSKLPRNLALDVWPYVKQLSEHSEHFKNIIAKERF